MTGESAGRVAPFAPLFGRWARALRFRLSARRVLTGAAIGLVVGAAGSGVLWKTGHGALRPFGGALGLLGAAVGAGVSRRRRWQDANVALYLDGRLGTGEVVATALELSSGRGAAGEASGRESEPDGEASGLVLAQASRALGSADPSRARPPFLSPWHLGAPLGAAMVAYLTWLPLPPRALAAQAPGEDRVLLAEVRGLEKAAKIRSLHAADDEQRKRLDAIARDADRLRERLREGMERREALAEIARLEDAVQNERLQLGDGERRRGLEAALSRLAQEPLTRDAARALGDRDLVRFDEEMQKIANAQEKSDRERARKALEEAAEAAKKAGALDVGRALDREKALLEQRGKRADELRELGEALKGSMTDEQKRDLEEFGHPGSDRDSRKLAKAMEDALKKLSPEERKRLAENLKKRLASGSGASPGAEQRMKDLARELSTEEGQKALEDQLRKLAAEESEDEDAERQRGLDDAEKGLGESQGQLGAPLPVPMAGPGSPGDKGKPGDKGDKGGAGDGSGKGDKGGAGDGDGAGGPGTHDTGTGPHKGQSRDVGGSELRSRAGVKLDARAPSAGITIGRGAGKPGDTASVRGEGAIGEVGPKEVSGVDRSEVPEEYREQVGRYFQP